MQPPHAKRPSADTPNSAKKSPPRATDSDPWARRFEEARRLTELDPAAREVHRRLSLLRLRLANEMGVPAYQILTNRQLLACCEQQPRNDEELVKLLGFSRFKLLAFGAEIVATIRSIRTKPP